MGDVIDLKPDATLTAADVMKAALEHKGPPYKHVLIIAVDEEGGLQRWSNTNKRTFHALAAAAAQDMSIKAMNGELIFE